MKKNETCYIGLASTYHDPAFAIVNAEGEVVFAEASERYLQNKRAMHAPPDDLIRLPRLVKKYCGEADLVISTSWPISVGRKMGRTSGLLRMLSPLIPDSQMITGSDGFAWPMGSVTGGLQWMANSIDRAGLNLRESPYLKNQILQKSYQHHLSHAATAAYTSPFSEAACAIIDGYGGSGSCSFYHFSKGRFQPVHHKGKWTDGSLGQFYAIVCSLCGFDPMTGEEWKVMGLAPYSSPLPLLYKKFQDFLAIDDLRIIVKLKNKGYIKWLHEMRILSDELRKTPNGCAQIASSGQAFFEDLLTELLINFHRKGLSDHLILSGGCALNSTYNGKIVHKTPFKKLHVPSAPGDDGCAIGAALLAFYDDHPEKVKKPIAESPYLGSEISSTTLKYCVQFANPEKIKHCPGTIVQEAAAILARGGIIGWMQGRAEFGPRALGNRSILADPRPKDMKDAINARVKFREQFRPFAPAILYEHCEEYIENFQESPYMERTLLFKEAVKHKIPAVVHENGSGRLQSVKRDWAPRYYDLIAKFHELTGVPVLLNTSFNVMGKPIVHSIEDALGVFHTSGLDALVIDEYLFFK